MIGELNRRITFKSWGSEQDPGGGPIPIVLSSYIMWAKVENRSGSPYTGEQQQVWNYDYKITFRYERSRVAKSNETIDYDNKRLAINSISFENEGNRKYAVARCTTTDANVDATNDVLAILSTYDYYGIAHEYYFTADSIPDLRGKTIIGAFKDGIEFNVLLGGSFTNPLIKQVIYNSATGTFTWSEPFEPGEHALIQYIDTIALGSGSNADDEVFGEIPSGLVNGSNATFTTAYDFVPGKISVHLNGLLQKMITHYNTSGTRTITFMDSPQPGDIIEVDYEKQ